MLMRNQILRFAAMLVAGVSLGLGAAHAQSSASTPSAVNATEGATTGLGTSHRFATAAAATAHCPGDTIVWSGGKKLTYVLPGAASYGKGSGFYACLMEAKMAGFHRKHS